MNKTTTCTEALVLASLRQLVDVVCGGRGCNKRPKRRRRQCAASDPPPSSAANDSTRSESTFSPTDAASSDSLARRQVEQLSAALLKQQRRADDLSSAVGDLRRQVTAFEIAAEKRAEPVPDIFSRSAPGWMSSRDAEDIKAFCTHSDNAAQHFKSGKTLEWYSRMLGMFENTQFIWDFGAPGHGKF